MSKWNSLTRIVAAAVAAGAASALALSPVAAITGVAAARTSATMQSNLQDLTDGSAPGVSTILDNQGSPIAWLYTQRRYSVPSEAIPQTVKDAIVSIEDRRFYEHKGVDLQGNLRAIAANLFAGGVEQGASTLDQQYVKNYLLLVTSNNADEQAAATETSIPRKLREMRMASTIDKMLSKDEILTRYLNLVPFGNNSFGIEAAARTHFGKSASELSLAQSAMFAGMVQSSSFLNPFTNADAVLERRNTVLDSMVVNGYINQEEADVAKAEPLGVLDAPQGLANGCIAAGDSGFFCDHVLNYLNKKGLSTEQITKGSYTIKTTLDPQTQTAAHNAVTSQVNAQSPGVADVMNIIEPGTNSRKILAMTSSRDYGLDLNAGQTVLPQTSSLVGAGAGSVFKIFTAAAALKQGYGLDTVLQVPRRYEAKGLGDGGASGCAPGTYCVENSGSYAPQMSLRDALAYSPNTPFVQLIESVGVRDVVDISVALGLRSYSEKGSFDQNNSIADYFKEHNLGSYTLGPTAVNALELSNVAASLASDGMWCEPSPIESVTDHNGNEVYLERPACEQAVSKEIANALANGLSQDTIKGTGAAAAKAAGFRAPTAAKTGTTESHQSAAFLGFNSNFASAAYIYNDGTTVSPLCTSPVSQCGKGTLFGGDEPARTWFSAATAAGRAATGTLPAYDTKYNRGSSEDLGSSYIGRNGDDVKRELTGKGYKVVTEYTAGNGLPKDHVVRTEVPVPLKSDSTIKLVLSDGTAPRRTTSPLIPRDEAPADDNRNQGGNDLANLLEQLLGR
ncbi:transglycosylase domain-containing protein [Corynebacterium ulcerans]|uniref:transglycosylase domain-containing protein n=1 Tax=Corynebacterium ulcerans TaxID=65058 RepID=UPI0002141550|nr:transglycosylase domain-containing protein [Corynebacterium ulcerans]AEG82964.1 putative secreted protein [Corynebacterium ulcerans BR-AD22]MBH5297426.1 transglycosylase domain-containing protein [Corynebacterium ulcerans]NOL59121.1 penicillin-binding protein [Corynebacterium ulcerans]NOM03390.1 penicillin-binding protein [Corynebacterium ulcerans]